MNVEATCEHQWLRRLVGNWVSQGEATPVPEGSETHRLTETGRPVGDLWVILEGRGEMPECGPTHTVMTLGYDPARSRFVGSWIGSMLANLWVYEGELDAAGNVLTLSAEGPSFHDPGKTARYRDVIELRGDDHRVLTSQVQGEDGAWTQFMELHYRRVG